MCHGDSGECLLLLVASATAVVERAAHWRIPVMGVVYGQAGTVVGLVEEDISERPSCVCAVYYPVRKRAMKKTFETYDIVKSDL